MLVFIIRTLFFLAMVAAGYAFGQAVGTGNEIWGMLGFTGGAIIVIAADVAIRRKDISVISAVFFGLIVGLVVAALLGPVVDMYTSVRDPVRDVI